MSLFGNRKKKKKEKKENFVLVHMMEQLGYKYHIVPEDWLVNDVVEYYNMAVERGKKEGFTPVLLPEDDVLDEYFGILKDEDGYEVEETLKRVGDNGKELLWKRLNELTNPEEDDIEALDLDEITGEMEQGGQVAVFGSLYDPDTKKSLILVEVPTRNPWEVVVYIPFGGWNDCPAPEEMASVCKYWYEKYGAVPALITHDTLEFVVPNPVPKEEAMQVAKEHFAFCTDRVDQCTGSGTLGEVADTLWRSNAWFFWWD